MVDALIQGSEGVSGVEIVICPPSLYVPQVSRLLAGNVLSVGAQNVSEYESGAFTGEVSTEMLKEFGCDYVIVGHSERRSIFAETDAQVKEKVVSALKAGLTPILCVGESQAEREAGRTMEVVSRQIQVVIDAIDASEVAKLIVAYEPVWAIGTGLTATPEQAQEVHCAIRAQIRGADEGVAEGLRILYGGSVKAGNAEELFGQPDIDGGLIGGASLDSEGFLGICRAATVES